MLALKNYNNNYYFKGIAFIGSMFICMGKKILKQFQD